MHKTGYFANWLEPGKMSRVHVVDAVNEEPICDTKVSPKLEFQWCAAGIAVQYLTCKKCLKILKGKYVVCPSCGMIITQKRLDAAIAQLEEA